MTQTNYGGAVEYIAAALVVLQILFAWFYLRGRRATWTRACLVIVAISLVVLWSITLTAIWLALFGSFYTSRAIPIGPGLTLFSVGYGWILFSSASLAIFSLGRYLVRKTPALHSPGRRNWIRAAGIVAVGAPAAVAAFGGLVERRDFGIAELDLPVPGLHPDLDGFRIVQVSDLHVSPYLSVRQASRVIDMANGLRADLTVFTGDLITELGDPLDDAIRELIRLRADSGVLGCMGNHEQYIGCRKYLESQAKRSGLIFLRNANAQIRRGDATLNIAGVDYQRSANRAEYLIGAERLVVPGASNLLLSHNPDVFPAAIGRGFQAVLAGHTHGGQVNVEILHQNINPARFRTPFTSGLYRQGPAGEVAASCFVTNGIGTIGLPIRLGAPPEIALLRLRRA